MNYVQMWEIDVCVENLFLLLLSYYYTRYCIGQTLAEQQQFLFLAGILNRLEDNRDNNIVHRNSRDSKNQKKK